MTNQTPETTIMTEEELRAFDPSLIEDKDIAWDNGTPEEPYQFTARVLFDYDRGLSILNKDDHEDCLTGMHGPTYAGRSNYSTKLQYHKNLTEAINMLKNGYYKGPIAITGIASNRCCLGITACAFT